MIDLARDIDKESRAVRKRCEEAVAVERTNYAKSHMRCLKIRN